MRVPLLPRVTLLAVAALWLCTWGPTSGFGVDVTGPWIERNDITDVAAVILMAIAVPESLVEAMLIRRGRSGISALVFGLFGLLCCAGVSVAPGFRLGGDTSPTAVALLLYGWIWLVVLVVVQGGLVRLFVRARRPWREVVAVPRPAGVSPPRFLNTFRFTLVLPLRRLYGPPT